LFSIISFMRTAPREWRRPDPRQAIDGCLRTAEGEADTGLLLQANARSSGFRSTIEYGRLSAEPIVRKVARGQAIAEFR
jgi:hypothetical protein